MIFSTLSLSEISQIGMALSVSSSALYLAFTAGKIKQTIQTHAKSIDGILKVLQSHDRDREYLKGDKKTIQAQQ